MFRTPIFIVLAAMPILAQSDPLASVSDGDRVEVTLKNGTTFKGDVVWCAEGKLKLDISFESPDTDGSLVFEGRDISRIAKLEKLTAEQKKALAKEKEERRKKLLAELAARDAADRARATTAPPEKKEDLAAKELLARFPFPEWSDERRKQLMQRDASKLSPEEQEFLARYADWKRARERVERDELVDKFSPANGWDEKRYAELMSRDPGSWKDDEKQFVQMHDQLVQARAAKATDDRAALLDEFPPGADWNEQAYTRLKDQFIRIGVPLSAKEKKFVDNFDDWQKALQDKQDKEEQQDEIKRKLQEQMEKEKQGGSDQTPPKK